MKLGVLFSGGKDSVYALSKALEAGEVKVLITIVSENTESYMFHTPNISITKMQAEAIGIPLMQKTTKGVKEEELVDLQDAIAEAKKEYGISGVYTGAIASSYQADRIKNICDELELELFNPIWGKDQEEFMRELVDAGFKVLVSGIFAYPLDESFLGKIVDHELIDRLVKIRDTYKINVAGEGGEIETTVLDAPFFKKRIEVKESEVNAKRNEGVCIIKKAVLSGK
ncbi:MAG TPA: TIGR00289 family protein [Candidatus Altiarchaeales archaeon]|nr:TIGR00289 family protein [Candidatus Altiarchaeales archaeon]